MNIKKFSLLSCFGNVTLMKIMELDSKMVLVCIYLYFYQNTCYVSICTFIKTQLTYRVKNLFTIYYVLVKCSTLYLLFDTGLASLILLCRSSATKDIMSPCRVTIPDPCRADSAWSGLHLPTFRLTGRS